ncbi:hypothetical protein CVIRNUC_006371 [Coccomyxa viridis]|uniref:Uncharacterized protein n=1 Tax=Coccomyxa viridis TaxID=1274662 RepID=A0AAV1I8Z5_9CHLO|nr:hypothetical protein CVIRNUC_006371 [Coccomyxa viridis]
MRPQESLNSSCSEATERMVTPAAWRAPKAGAQPMSPSCQPCLQPSTVVELKTNQQPRLTKALLDQHEKAALTSLMLMQHHCLADKGSPSAPVHAAVVAQELQAPQPSCEASDTCSETGSSSHPPPRRSARRCKRKLPTLMDTHQAPTEQLSYPAPICQPTTRQLQFPVSRQAAGAVVQSLLRHHSTPGQLQTPCGVPAWAAAGQKRPQPDLDHARCVRQLPAFRSTACRPLACAELQVHSSALPEEVVPGTWSIQVWPVPSNCDMG